MIWIACALDCVQLAYPAGSVERDLAMQELWRLMMALADGETLEGRQTT